MATQQQLAAALRAADAAGNVEDARRLAQAYAAARAKPQADFSDATTVAGDTYEPVQVGGQPVDAMPGWKQSAYGAVSGVADSIVGVGQMTGLMDDQTAQQSLARIRAVRESAPVSSVVGDIAMLAAPAAKIGQLPKAGAYLGNALLGAGMGASRGVADGESRATNTAVGGALGWVGQGLAGGLGKLADRSKNAIDPLKRELAGVAQRYNIPLHAAQLSESMPVKTLASIAKYLPFSGATKAQSSQQEAFNRALGETFGMKGMTRLSDDAMADAGKQIGAVYDDIYSRNPINISPPILGRMTAIVRSAENGLEDAQAAVVRKQFRAIVNNFANGPIAGSKYQDLRGVLAESAANNGSGAGNAIKGLRKALDDAAMSSVGGADAATLKANNARYANYMTVRNALKQAGGASETVAPGNLWNLIKKGSTKDMRELARVGKVLLQDSIPDSGTAPRNFMLSLLGTGGATAPMSGGATLLPAVGALAGGATLGRFANSNALANMMLRSGRGQTQNALATLARPGAIGMAPVVPKPERRKKSDKRP